MLVVSSGARAEWHEAASPHFVILADDSPGNIYKFSQELERFHAAMSLLTGYFPSTPSSSNRVTIFIMSNDTEVQRIAGAGASRYLGGFYKPRAGGSVAFVSRVRGSSTHLDISKIMLLHEYAHHFMMSGSAQAMPRWYSEGAAEFFASASFPPDGGVLIGKPANHRAAELAQANDVSVINLLDPATYGSRPDRGYDEYYGKSWALFHYLTFEPSRQGQLNRYLAMMQQGKSSREAALEAFGNLAALDSQLERYIRRSTMTAFKFEANVLAPGTSQMRKLSPGEAAMMPVMAQSRSGVNQKEAAALIIEARAVAARFPTDAAVQAALAEAEFDSDHDAEAVAAADRALAVDAKLANAWVQKGYALFRMAENFGDVAAYRKARAAFAALNQIEHEHPIPLIYYYRTFAQSGETMPQVAKLGLVRASQIAPFDMNVRMMVARMQLGDGQRDAARRMLRPVALNPHAGELARSAQAMLDEIDGGTPPPEVPRGGAAESPIAPGQEKGAPKRP